MKKVIPYLLYAMVAAAVLVPTYALGPKIDTTGEGQRREREAYATFQAQVAKGYALFSQPMTAGAFIRIRGFWAGSERKELWLVSEIAGERVYMQHPAYICGVYCQILISPLNERMAKVQQVIYTDSAVYKEAAAEYARQGRSH